MRATNLETHQIYTCRRLPRARPQSKLILNLKSKRLLAGDRLVKRVKMRVTNLETMKFIPVGGCPAPDKPKTYL